MVELYRGVFAMFSNGTTINCEAPALRVQSGWQRYRIYAAIVATYSLVGCQGTPPQTPVKTTSQPALVVQTTPNLSGTWVGAVPPSSDGLTVSDVVDSGYIPKALLQIDMSDVHGNTGKLTLCSMHQTSDAVSFSNVQLGKSAVAFNENRSTITLVKLSDDAGSLTLSLHMDSNLLAGVLHHGSVSDFRARCKV